MVLDSVRRCARITFVGGVSGRARADLPGAGSALPCTRARCRLALSCRGQRYHPAIVAQAAATLVEMFPGRFWIALGTGQLLNEHITADPHPFLETSVGFLGHSDALSDLRKHGRLTDAYLHAGDGNVALIGEMT
jgi:Glucodextranase, domain N/Luciferase-like monooxygenase